MLELTVHTQRMPSDSVLTFNDNRNCDLKKNLLLSRNFLLICCLGTNAKFVTITLGFSWIALN